MERLKNSRKGLKAALTRTKNAIETDLAKFKEGDDPVTLEIWLGQWKVKMEKFQNAEDAVICHEESDAHDADKDVVDHERALAAAEGRVTTLRRLWDKRQDAALTLTQDQSRNAGNEDHRGLAARLQKLDIPKPPIIEEAVDHRGFKQWLMLWNNYARLATLSQRPQAIQVGMFWSNCSTGFLRAVQNSVRIPQDTNRPLSEVLTLIEEYLRSLRNKYLDLMDLLAVKQGQGQDYTSLCNVIRELADYAGIGKITEDMLLIGLLLHAMSSEEDKAKVMEKNPETFEDARKYILELETARRGAKAIGATGAAVWDDLEVNRTFKNSSTYKKGKNPPNVGKVGGGKSSWVTDCGRCGYNHPNGKCRTRKKTCTSCGKLGHFEAKCLGEGKGDNLSPNAIQVGRIFKARKLQILTTVGSTSARLSWLPDTGADCNVMGLKDFKKFGDVKLNKDGSTLTAPGCVRLPYQGNSEIMLHMNNKAFKTEVHVIEGNTDALMGYEACVGLGLIEERWPDSRCVRKLSLKNNQQGNQIPMTKNQGTTPLGVDPSHPRGIST